MPFSCFALFSCCNFFHVACFSLCTLFTLHFYVLHFFRIVIFSCFTISFTCHASFVLRSSNALLFLLLFISSMCFTFSLFCVPFMIHFFVLHFVLVNFLNVEFFLCCTFSILYSFMFCYFHFALFACCTLLMLHFFRITLISGCTFFMFLFFRVALFSCCFFNTLFMLHFLHVALFSYCNVIREFFRTGFL